MTFTHNQLLQIRANKKAARTELDKAGLNDWKFATKLEGNSEPPTKIDRHTKTISVDKLILSSLPEEKFVSTFLIKIDEIKKVIPLPKVKEVEPSNTSIEIKTDDDLNEIESEAETVMEQYNLINDGWKFVWADEPKAYLGRCNGTKKQISLNRRWMKVLPPEEVTDVILHEVAHALVGVREKHNNVWKRKCKEIGARPEAKSNYSWGTVEMDYEVYKMLNIKQYLPKWKYSCDSCGRVSYSRKIKTISCSNCSGGSYNEKYKMKKEKYEC